LVINITTVAGRRFFSKIHIIIFADDIENEFIGLRHIMSQNPKRFVMGARRSAYIFMVHDRMSRRTYDNIRGGVMRYTIL